MKIIDINEFDDVMSQIRTINHKSSVFFDCLIAVYHLLVDNNIANVFKFRILK